MDGLIKSGKFWGSCVMLVCLTAVVKAQVIPTTQTQPSAPTQTVNPTPAAYPTGFPINSVRSWEAEMPFASDTSLSIFRTVQQVKQTTDYLDGFGRLVQSVIKGISPNGNDLVSPHVYDAYGRETNVYEPYVSPTNDGNLKNSPYSEQSTFMAGMYPGEQVFYWQTAFEASPLNRILDSYESGNSWAGNAKGKSIQYLINETVDSVEQWQMFYNSSLQVIVSPPSGGNQTITYIPSHLPANVGTVLYLYQTPGATSWTTGNVNNGQTTQITIPAGTYNYAIELTGTPNVYVYPGGSSVENFTTSGFFPAGSLNKTVTADENNNQVIEFRDLRGLVLLKKIQAGLVTAGAAYTNWLSTYYVYDDDNNLAWVIPPAATQLLRAASWTLPATGIAGAPYASGLCFNYTYDGRKRVTTKSIPGARPVLMVYDARDRMVMSQDSNLRAQGIWSYISYDSLNRPILTGVWINAGNQAAQQAAAVQSLTYPAPTANNTVLTQTYFDDYSWVAGSGSSLSSTLITTYTGNTSYFATASDINFPYPRAIVANYQTKGQVTGTRINVLSTSNYLYAVHFYDDRGRVIQTHSTNFSTAKDTVTNQYGFTGRLLASLTGHGKGGVNALSYFTLMQHTYDASGRVTAVTEVIGSSQKDTLATYQYDELGRLALKKLGRTRSSLTNFAYTANPVDTMRYTYNIRGWLHGINKDYANSMNSASNWFGMELDYDYGFNQAQLNGNIAGSKWRDANDGAQRAYGFSYDNANRLIKGDFTQYTNSTWGTSAGVDFSLHGVTYDLNGNILSLNQMGIKVNTPKLIDSILYGYNPNSNQLNYATDRANDTSAHLGDFTEINNNNSQDYTYDGNGNLTLDNNKGISSIQYNLLNLASTVIFAAKGSITYVYDAAGNKQQKITTDNVTNKKTITTYLGSFVYQSTASPTTSTGLDTLQFILNPEGRARPKNVGKSDTLFYDFFERDHLGNTRVVLTDQLEQDVYPAATVENNAASLAVQSSYYNINLSDTVNVNHIASWNSTAGNGYPNNNGNPPYNTDPDINTSAISSYVYHLNGSTGDKTGLGITLRVMTGDVVSINAKSFWHNNTGGNPNNSSFLINSALSTFIGLFAASPAVTAVHGATPAALESSTATSSNVNSWLTSVPNPAQASIPRAYINWILFNDQFVPIASNCGYDLVSLTPDNVKSHNVAVPIGTSGYLYVYCSNESNLDVYFDNFQVSQTDGPLMETNNYYPGGLVMQGISDRALKPNYAQNKYRYNGKELQSQEFSDGSGLEEYDYGARMYDPQIMRWSTPDPLADKLRKWSPYNYCLDNPIRFEDPDGMGPGQRFKSQDAAAVDWARTYRKGNRMELSSLIYRVHTQKGKEYYSYTAPVHYDGNDKNHDNAKSSPPPTSNKHILPDGLEGEVTAAIHSHPAGDALSEEFSKETIGNGGKGDEYIMSEADEIDYYLLTPSGKLLERDNSSGTNAYLGNFDETTGAFVKGGKIRNINDKDLFPVAMDKDDPLKPGGIQVPWDPKRLPPDLRNENGNSKRPNCLGCYVDPPEWLKPHRSSFTNNTGNL